ncbi:hypothetical protein ACA910_003031 [Epithemia clementina (nom. ined.)]
MVKSVVDMVGNNSAAQFLEVDGDLREIEYKLSILKTLLCVHLDDLGTSTVFEMLERLANSTSASTVLPKTLLCDRPDDLVTSTIFEMLEQLADSTSASTAGQQQAVRFRNPAPSSPSLSKFSLRFTSLERDFCSFKSTITWTVYSKIKKSLDKMLMEENSPFQLARPVIRFLQQWSSGPDGPGDR